jgi:thioesterase domain-containing protein/acyl carrier protein
VAEAVVVARGDGRGSQELVAYVVPETGETVTVGDLRQVLQAKLPAYMVPGHVVFLETMPRTPNGKIDRRALPQPAAGRAQSGAPYVPPRTATEATLAAIWQEILKVETIGVQDHFFDLGGHSLLAIQLMAGVHQRLGRAIPLVTLYERPTIEHMAEVLERYQGGPTAWTPLQPLQTSGTKPPFFAMPGTGMTRYGFQPLAQALGSDQPFYALQAPGSDNRQPPFNNIPDLAAHYVEAIRSVQPSGPYYLGGHSFGGLAAFEAARILGAQGAEVALLVIMDMVAPVYEWPSEWNDHELQPFIETFKGIEQRFGVTLPVSAADLAATAPDERLEFCWQQLQVAGLLPPGADVSLIKQVIAFQQASNEALRTYPRQAQPTDQALVLLRATETDGISFPRRLPALDAAADMGWGRLVTGHIAVHSVPGDHFSMLTEANAAAMAEQLRAYLA